MNLEALHALVRDMARDGNEHGDMGAKALHQLSGNERAAVQRLCRRVQRAGGFTSVTPVSGSSMWMTPPKPEQAK